jgi:tRNA pseudouridine38-40 synthase
MRVKAVIAYDGSAFYGFQRQTSTPLTVTRAIEEALKGLQIDTSIVGSGRTDRGVHATGQVIHFDLPYFWRDLEKLRHILNRRLDHIFFRKITAVSETFHARFHATKRLYRYIFKTTPLCLFERNYLSSYQEGFDTEKLKDALQLFVGEHDFRYFHKRGSDIHTTVRTVYRADYYSYKGLHIIRFEANGFLRSQVRMMVDAAMLCAQGALTRETLREQIDANTQVTTRLAPPEGLYLAKIYYRKET